MTEATSDAEQIIRDWWTMANEKEFSELHDIVSESFVWETPAVPTEIRGPDAAEGVWREVTSAFPDFKGEPVEILTAEGSGMAELRYTMTHEGEYNGIPPTGREVELPLMATWRVSDGKLQELRNYANMQVLLEQIGVTEK